MADTHADFLMEEIHKLDRLIKAQDTEIKLLREMNDFLKQLAYQHGWMKEHSNAKESEAA